jgi:hypothetical protein
MGCNIMTLYLLGLTICTNCWKARTLGASWRWLSLAKNGDFLIGRGNILLNLGGEGGPAALTDKNRRCVSNSTGEDPLRTRLLCNLSALRKLAISNFTTVASSASLRPFHCGIPMPYIIQCQNSFIIKHVAAASFIITLIKPLHLILYRLSIAFRLMCISVKLKANGLPHFPSKAAWLCLPDSNPDYASRASGQFRSLRSQLSGKRYQHKRAEDGPFG